MSFRQKTELGIEIGFTNCGRIGYQGNVGFERGGIQSEFGCGGVILEFEST